MRTGLVRTVFWTGVLTLICYPLLAQEQGNVGSITIEVKDRGRAPIPKAQVQILSSLNTIEKNLTTGDNGRLAIDMPAGTYDLNVTSEGFRPSAKRIEIQNGSQQSITFILDVGSCPQCVTIYASPMSFPETSVAASPNGYYAIVGVDSDKEPYHTIFLEDRVLKKRRTLFTYARHVTFVWNPDSEFFAVTDNLGSDTSRCSVFSVEESVAPIQVLDRLSEQLSEGARERLKRELSNSHVYVEALGWLGPTELALKISGYGTTDPAGFTDRYILHVTFSKP